MISNVEILKFTVLLMKDKGILLSDLAILSKELASTLSNYFLYISLLQLAESDDEFNVSLFMNEYDISYNSLDFLKENYDKIFYILDANTIDTLKVVKEEDQNEFKLIQNCVLVYLSQEYEWKKVIKMTPLFGLRRNLKKKNKAILIDGLFSILMCAENN